MKIPNFCLAEQSGTKKDNGAFCNRSDSKVKIYWSRQGIAVDEIAKKIKEEIERLGIIKVETHEF